MNLELKRHTPHPGPLPFERGEGESSSNSGACGGSGVQSGKSCFRRILPALSLGKKEIKSAVVAEWDHEPLVGGELARGRSDEDEESSSTMCELFGEFVSDRGLSSTRL
jgi:hypothetical protein